MDRFRIRCALTILLLLAGTTAPAQRLIFTHFAGSNGGGGSEDNTGTSARFSFASSVAVDSSGNVYVSDTNNSTIRKVSSSGAVTTLAGIAGAEGSLDGTGSAARFNRPQGIAVDSAGNVYVADTANSTIRKITPAGVVTTLAGRARNTGSSDGTGAAAEFDYPQGVAVDRNGIIYVADTDNFEIRKITPAGVVTTLAGKSPFVDPTDGQGSEAHFDTPGGIAVDNAGNVYVADTENSTIRKITPAGLVSTLAGRGNSSGSVDGTGSAARFESPSGVGVDSAGNVYVADTFNSTIRKITPDGVVTTLAGSAGSTGATDATGSLARFTYPTGVAVDSSGNLYVADLINSAIRKVTPAGAVTTFAGSAPAPGAVDATAPAARFNAPRAIAFDRAGNIYVADMVNSTIRKITRGGAAVTTLAGTAEALGSTDGTGAAARFRAPRGVAVDAAGNVYVADTGNHTIRKSTPAGVVTTFAGTAGASGSTDGTGSAARFDTPHDVAIDSSGNIYVADTRNSTIRKITSAGAVTTLAGDPRFVGNRDGTGANATFNEPNGIAVDPSGDIYVADSENHIIRKVTPSGVVSTFAGDGREGSRDGAAEDARFLTPRGLAVDAAGNVYVADTDNATIRKITASGTVTTLGGLAEVEGSADGIGSAARFYSPTDVAVNSDGILYIADMLNNSIRLGAPAIADTATIDSNVVKVGTARQLDTTPQTATEWQWTIIRRPTGSTAVLSSGFIRNPTFVPDVADLYVFRVVASSANGTSISVVSLGPYPIRRHAVVH